MFVWAQEIAPFVAGRATTAPAFWRLLSPQVRLHDLMYPLAVAAMCRYGEACESHPEVFHWLAGQALQGVSRGKRREWLRTFWALADDMQVERLRQRVALAPLTLEERAGQVGELSAGPLPWATVERKLLEPQLMQRIGEAGDPPGAAGAQALLGGAWQRGELDSFDRLIDSAGPAKACLAQTVLYLATFWDDEFAALSPHFFLWVQGIAVPYKPKAAREPCNPLKRVVAQAFCAGGEDDEQSRASVGRFRAIWEVMLQSGITLDSPAIQPMLAPQAPGEPPRCREPEPGTLASPPPVARLESHLERCNGRFDLKPTIPP